MELHNSHVLQAIQYRARNALDRCVRQEITCTEYQAILNWCEISYRREESNL